MFISLSELVCLILFLKNDPVLAFGIDVSNSIDAAQIIESVRWINNLDINSDKRFFFFADKVSQIEKVNKGSLSKVLADLILITMRLIFREF